jgi:hypothetical protein
MSNNTDKDKLEKLEYKFNLLNRCYKTIENCRIHNASLGVDVRAASTHMGKRYLTGEEAGEVTRMIQEIADTHPFIALRLGRTALPYFHHDHRSLNLLDYYALANYHAKYFKSALAIFHHSVKAEKQGEKEKEKEKEKENWGQHVNDQGMKHEYNNANRTFGYEFQRMKPALKPNSAQIKTMKDLFAVIHHGPWKTPASGIQKDFHIYNPAILPNPQKPNDEFYVILRTASYKMKFQLSEKGEYQQHW